MKMKKGRKRSNAAFAANGRPEHPPAGSIKGDMVALETFSVLKEAVWVWACVEGRAIEFPMLGGVAFSMLWGVEVSILWEVEFSMLALLLQKFFKCYCCKNSENFQSKNFS